MRRSLRSLLPSVLLPAGWALLASVAHAQSTRIEIRKDSRGDVECFRDGRRVSCESLRTEREAAERAERLREQRDREQRLRDERLREEQRRDDRVREERAARDREWERAQDARERATERSRQLREQAQERARIEHERAQERTETARRIAEATRRQQQDWAAQLRRDLERERVRERAREAARRRQYDLLRPNVSLGGGADIRRFDDVNRYFANAAVDFHTRFGLGIRPEVVYGWTDRQTETLPLVVCPACSATPPTLQVRSRSQMLGVNLNATYALLRGSPIRPYLLGGVGLLTTREVTPMVTSSAPLPGSVVGSQVTYGTTSRNEVDAGLNAGAGLEFGRGPVRVFTELRYFLTDRQSPRGFSGMLPITAGLRF